jgi:hypothetical protein
MLISHFFRHCFNKSFKARKSLAMSVETLESRRVPSVVNPYVAVAPVIDTTAHTWTADSTGKYHTSDLAAEWQTDYQLMQSPKTLAGLSPLQRWEGNAEAVFENTKINTLPALTQQIYREDAQREIDAVWAAMQTNSIKLNINVNTPLTEQTYLSMETTLQNNSTLLELAVQGHGLNNPPASRYAGYTNDFQNNVDGTTLYIGGGHNTNNNALTDFFDDDIMSHAPFSVVWHNGGLIQLNQNGNLENSLETAVTELDDTLYYRVYTSAMFSQTAVTKAHYNSPAPKYVEGTEIQVNRAPANGQIVTAWGLVPTTLSSVDNTTLAHTWVADANGLFHPVDGNGNPIDLSAEWKANYQAMLSGNFGSLTPLQRWEGNAEAVFENTGISKLSATQQEVDREDAQREFDAAWAAMQINNAVGPFTNQSYLSMEATVQGNASLEELSVQGHGLNNPPAPRYAGYTNDFQNNVDQTTLYIGGGLNNHGKAIADFFDDNVMSHAPFPVVWHNGVLVQLNQNGNRENKLSSAVTALNQTLFYRVLTSNDFQS